MQLCPPLAMWQIHKIGPGRAQALAQPGGVGAYDFKTLMKQQT